MPFNSTRCIRNWFSCVDGQPAKNSSFQLHTVHQEPDHPNRQGPKLSNLSTPHGALGTTREFLTHRLVFSLSTPHGALGTQGWSCVPPCQNVFQLHTVHQERGTPQNVLYKLFNPFNSTRCIRNLQDLWEDAYFCGVPVFQLHTVHQEHSHNSYNLPGIDFFQLHTVHQEPIAFLRMYSLVVLLLSTPHGALGTRSWDR